MRVVERGVDFDSKQIGSSRTLQAEADEAALEIVTGRELAHYHHLVVSISKVATSKQRSKPAAKPGICRHGNCFQPERWIFHTNSFHVLILIKWQEHRICASE